MHNKTEDGLSWMKISLIKFKFVQEPSYKQTKAE